MASAQPDPLLPLNFTKHRQVEANVDYKDKSIANAYSSIPGSNFRVRKGPNYAKNGLKAPSDREFYELVSFDVFYTKSKISHLGRFLILPELEKKNDTCLPDYFIANFQVPLYEPPNPVWGDAKENGDGLQAVIVWRVTDYAKEQVTAEKPTGAAQLLNRVFVQPPTKESIALREQLKAIPFVVNPEDLDLNGLTKKLIESNNGKPFMTGPRCHTWYTEPRYLEVDCDVHKFVYIARKAAYHLWDSCTPGVMDLGLVMQANPDIEMPEQMLATCRTFRLDHKDMKQLSHYVSHYKKLRKEAKAVSEEQKKPEDGQETQ